MLTRADRDAAYNNNAVVSDGEQITQRWSAASAKIARNDRSTSTCLMAGRSATNGICFQAVIRTRLAWSIFTVVTGKRETESSIHALPGRVGLGMVSRTARLHLGT